MQIFLDTNILLNYLKGNKLDEKSFPKLLELLLKKKFLSITTGQIYDEYIRNISNSKNEKIEQIAPSQKDISINPINYKNLKLFNQEVKKSIEKINKVIAQQKKNILKEKTNFSKREKNIKVLFENSTILNEDYEILKKAEVRYLKGNPPRKKKERHDSYGDAINWELLLRDSDKKDSLSIISFDSDYAEQLYGTIKLNSLLCRDWKKISRKKIKLFTTIGEFLNDFAGKEIIDKKLINIEKENIKDDILSEKLNEDSEYRSRRVAALSSLRDYVKNILIQLSPREQKILEMRFGLVDGVAHTLEEVAQEFEVSRERIRQIESKSLEKIRKFQGLEKIKDY